jgi:hypothetical protein
MMSTRDPLTGFDARTFTVGAVGGAATIAAAFAAVIQNARAANFARWDRQALVDGIEFSEQMRARLYREVQVSNRRMLEMQSEMIALTAELKAMRAREILRRR